MIQVIYRSQSRQHFSASDLRTLLLRSRLRNRDAGVTGMMIHANSIFLQALEGDAEVVRAVLDRIARDQRHDQLTILATNRDLGAREFAEWSMGFANAAQAVRSLRGAIDISGLGSLAILNITESRELLIRSRSHVGPDDVP